MGFRENGELDPLLWVDTKWLCKRFFPRHNPIGASVNGMRAAGRRKSGASFGDEIANPMAGLPNSATRHQGPVARIMHRDLALELVAPWPRRDIAPAAADDLPQSPPVNRKTELNRYLSPVNTGGSRAPPRAAAPGANASPLRPMWHGQIAAAKFFSRLSQRLIIVLLSVHLPWARS